MVEFFFKHSSCVAVGTFNIYILQPRLLADMGVFELDKERPTLVSGDLSQPGVRFDAADCVWTVRPDRLAVESKIPSVDCGSLVAKTLGALCWTPIMGVGINASFTSKSKDVLPDSLRLPSHPDATQRTIHLAVPADGSTLNMQLSRAEDTMELSLNNHTEVTTWKENPQESNLLVRQICDSFVDRRRAAVVFAKEVLNAEFSYDN